MECRRRQGDGTRVRTNGICSVDDMGRKKMEWKDWFFGRIKITEGDRISENNKRDMGKSVRGLKVNQSG